MRESLTRNLAAAGKKWPVISGKDRIKLVIKLVLRLFGIKKPLYLGGFYIDDDRRQWEQDQALYRKLKQDQEEAGYFAIAVEQLDRGGLEEVVGILAEELKNRGVSVRVFCLQSGGEMADRLAHSGLEVLVFQGNKEKLRVYCQKNRPQLVNTHFISRWLDVFHEEAIPVVEVIHNTYVFMDAKSWQRERDKMSWVNCYIAVSRRAADVFRMHLPELSPARIKVIGNGVTAKPPAISREEMRRHLGIAEDAFVYMATGSIDARKNQLGILRAWDIASRLIKGSCVLVIAGAGTNVAYENKVKELAATRGLVADTRIIFTGHSDQIRELLNMSDAFILASYYEGCSMAAGEALSAGLPLIHTDCGSGAELIAEGSNGILTDNPLSGIETYEAAQLYDAMYAGENENIEQLAQAICRLWEDKAIWRARRERIAKYAEEHFSIEGMVDRYMEVFQEVLRGWR